MLQSEADTKEHLNRATVIAAHDFLFLKIALAMAAAATIAFVWHMPPGGPSGDTWLGYILGTLSAGLVIWLAVFGIRKRRYAGGRVDLRTWLSGHIYAGILVVWLATLHSGFRITLSLHGLAWLLLLLTVASGVFGLQAYIRYPRMIAANRGDTAFGTLLAQISELDTEILAAAMPMGDEINRDVHAMIENTVVGGTLRQRLTGNISGCPTTAARRRIESAIQAPGAGPTVGLRRLLGLVTRKEVLLSRARRELQLLAWLQIWLFVHVPLTCGLLAAIATHVVAVFFFR